MSDIGQSQLDGRGVRRQRGTPAAQPDGHRRRVLIPASTSAFLSLTIGFATLITIGTLFLMLPISSVKDGAAPFIVSVFTATSAVCVTGLVVVSSGAYWTWFGQAVLVVLMFMGGLGIMSAGLVMLAAIGRRITLNQHLLVRETLGAGSLGSAVRLGKYVLIFAVAAQLVGVIVLFLRLIFEYSPAQALWQSLFHSVSAFNNAGFSIFPESTSLSAFKSDPTVLATIGVGILIGALSFPVLNEVLRRRKLSTWSLDTRLVVLGTIGLWLIGIATVVIFEFGNHATLGAMPLGEKISNGLFLATTAKTAGFSTISFGDTRAGTDFLFMLMMFVGGASGSVAGGIKINTAMVLVVATVAAIRGRPRTEIHKREIPYAQVVRALSVLVLAATGVVLFIVLLSFTERFKIDAGLFDLGDTMFEIVSAFGTVGLSRGITPDLSDPGKLVVTLAMYVGRLGPLTIGLGLALRERRSVYRYASERVRIG